MGENLGVGVEWGEYEVIWGVFGEGMIGGGLGEGEDVEKGGDIVMGVN